MALSQSANVDRLTFEVTGVAYRLMQVETVEAENSYGWLNTNDIDRA